MDLNNFDKHQYLQGINCSCILLDFFLANLNSSSTTLTALITYFLDEGYRN